MKKRLLVWYFLATVTLVSCAKSGESDVEQQGTTGVQVSVSVPGCFYVGPVDGVKAEGSAWYSYPASLREVDESGQVKSPAGVYYTVLAKYYGDKFDLVARPYTSLEFRELDKRKRLFSVTYKNVISQKHQEWTPSSISIRGATKTYSDMPANDAFAKSEDVWVYATYKSKYSLDTFGIYVAQGQDIATVTPPREDELSDNYSSWLKKNFSEKQINHFLSNPDKIRYFSLKGARVNCPEGLKASEQIIK